MADKMLPSKNKPHGLRFVCPCVMPFALVYLLGPDYLAMV